MGLTVIKIIIIVFLIISATNSIRKAQQNTQQKIKNYHSETIKPRQQKISPEDSLKRIKNDMNSMKTIIKIIRK